MLLFIAVRNWEKEGASVFNPFSVGMHYLAPAAPTRRASPGRTGAHRCGQIENTGVKMDATLGENYVALKTLTVFPWEFYWSELRSMHEKNEIRT
ncbi:MAG: hypothetical protein IPM82_22975 [Saprospiraceae bacterium]|nr:hypothetical protein [Saprospiraceae bacterium]